MGVELIESFRNRYYIDELRFCKLLNIRPLELDEIRRRNKRLNASNFKSELWFIEFLKTIDLNFVCYRNYPILNRFFADFYIKEINTVIEIDGRSHDNSQEYDLMRDKIFSRKCLKVIRIKYLDEEEAKRVCASIKYKLSNYYEYSNRPSGVRYSDNKKKKKKKKKKKYLPTLRKNKFANERWNKMMLDALKK